MSEGARIADQLRVAVVEGVAIFDGVHEARTRAQRGGGWSAREVIGHLIDSACNNHRRFIVNQSEDVDHLIVLPYAQDDWVSRGRYRETPASELVALWAGYNRQLARVIEAIPDAVLNRPRGPMAGHSFGYSDASSDMATLRHIAEDYVGHIRHHLRAIREVLGAGD